MKLKFNRAEVLKLAALLPKDTDKIALVKDAGIYLMSFAEPAAKEGEGTVRRTVVYAKGYNPKTDGDVWEKSRNAMGGDDGGDDIGTRAELMAILAKSEGEIEINVTARTLAISYLPLRTEAQKAARIAALKDWLARGNQHPKAQWSPAFKRNMTRLKKELAGLEAEALSKLPAGVA